MRLVVAGLVALALLGCGGSKVGAADGGTTSDGPADVNAADAPERPPMDATAEPPPAEASGDDAGDATDAAADAPGDGTTDADASGPVVTALVITPNEVTGALQCGPQQATATATYSDGTFADVSSQVAWSSSDTTIVAVASGGIVSCVGFGMVTLQATFAGLTATGFAICNPGVLRSVTIAPSMAGVAVGGGVQFSVLGNASDGSWCDGTRNAAWQTGTPSVATIASGWNGGGLATALAAGSTTVSATLNGIQSTTPATLQVIDEGDGGTSGDAGSPLAAIVVAPPSPIIVVGCPQPATATADLADGTTTDVTASVAWSTSPTFIATVGAGGVVSCIAPGHATISASYGGLTGQATATCAEPAIASVSVTPSSATIDAGDTLQYAASALYSTNRQCDVTQAAIWSSSVPAVASIVGNYGPVSEPDAGFATGLDAGTTQISAYIGWKTGTATLAVQ